MDEYRDTNISQSSSISSLCHLRRGDRRNKCKPPSKPQYTMISASTAPHQSKTSCEKERKKEKRKKEEREYLQWYSRKQRELAQPSIYHACPQHHIQRTPTQQKGEKGQLQQQEARKRKKKPKERKKSKKVILDDCPAHFEAFSLDPRIHQQKRQNAQFKWKWSLNGEIGRHTWEEKRWSEELELAIYLGYISICFTLRARGATKKREPRTTIAGSPQDTWPSSPKHLEEKGG